MAGIFRIGPAGSAVLRILPFTMDKGKLAMGGTGEFCPAFPSASCAGDRAPTTAFTATDKYLQLSSDNGPRRQTLGCMVQHKHNDSDPQRPWLVISYNAGTHTRCSFQIHAEAQAYAAKLKAANATDPNPTPNIKLVSPTEVVKQVFTPDQVKTMFRTARPQERGMLSLALHVGVRAPELERMSPDMVDLEHRAISIPGKLCLDGRHFVMTSRGDDREGAVPCVPRLAWDWLTEFPFQPMQWAALRNRLSSALGFWIQDGCRRTAFANYAAIHGSAGGLMLLGLGTDSSLMARNCLSLVSPPDAARFYSLTPAVVLAENGNT